MPTRVTSDGEMSDWLLDNSQWAMTNDQFNGQWTMTNGLSIDH
jgi:hypothetical protein